MIYGIVADNYKLERFKKELAEKGWTNYTISPFKGDTSIIKVTTDKDETEGFKKLCIKVEFHFKRSN